MSALSVANEFVNLFNKLGISAQPAAGRASCYRSRHVDVFCRRRLSGFLGPADSDAACSANLFRAMLTHSLANDSIPAGEGRPPMIVHFVFDSSFSFFVLRALLMS